MMARGERREGGNSSENNSEGGGGTTGMHPTTGNDPAPAPSPASHCSWGGSRVLAADDEG